MRADKGALRAGADAQRKRCAAMAGAAAAAVPGADGSDGEGALADNDAVGTTPLNCNRSGVYRSQIGMLDRRDGVVSGCSCSDEGPRFTNSQLAIVVDISASSSGTTGGEEDEEYAAAPARASKRSAPSRARKPSKRQAAAAGPSSSVDAAPTQGVNSFLVHTLALLHRYSVNRWPSCSACGMQKACMP